MNRKNAHIHVPVIIMLSMVLFVSWVGCTQEEAADESTIITNTNTKSVVADRVKCQTSIDALPKGKGYRLPCMEKFPDLVPRTLKEIRAAEACAQQVFSNWKPGKRFENSCLLKNPGALDRVRMLAAQKMELMRAHQPLIR